MAAKTRIFTYILATNSFFLISLSYTACVKVHDAHADVLSLINAIQKRYYVIRRLEGSFETLMKNYEHMCGPSLRRGCSLDTELNKVNKLWQDCLVYKSIMDDTQTRELLMHLIVLYDALLKTYGINHQPRLIRSSECIGDLLEEIDFLAVRSKGLLGKPMPHVSVQLLFPDIGQDLFFNEAEHGVEPDDTLFERLDAAYQRGEFVVNTTVRFYMIQRMARSVDALLALCARLRPGYQAVLGQVVADGMKSAAARDCVERLRQEQSLEPLEDLWHSLSSYRYIGDSYVIRECLVIIVHLYQLLMRYLSPETAQQAASEEEVMGLYTTISSLPLPELLSLLDELTEQSSTIIAVYQQGSSQGWQATLKHYWWVPPVLVAGCASLYLRIKRLLGHTSFRPLEQSVPVQAVV